MDNLPIDWWRYGRWKRFGRHGVESVPCHH